MNISKFIDFYLVENTSKKTGNVYYAITLRIKDNDYVLCFLTKDRYEMLKSTLNN